MFLIYMFQFFCMLPNASVQKLKLRNSMFLRLEGAYYAPSNHGHSLFSLESFV